MLHRRVFRPTAHRRDRLLVVLSHRSRRLATFIVGGIVVGAVAVALALAADAAGRCFGWLFGRWPLLTLMVTPIGFASCTFMAGRFFPNSGGSGIPQAIAARQLSSQTARGRLVSLRLAVGKIVLLLVGLLCGASIGREGPTVQVGASIMFAVGRLSPRRQPGLILAGAGAGVAAAFNTPLAGIVFTIEEMSRALEPRTTGLVIGAVIAAGLTSLSLQGDYAYFGTTHARLIGTEGWLAVPLIGIAGGVLGGAFSRSLILFGIGSSSRIARRAHARPIAFAALCGLVVAICGLLSGGTTFGTGYAQAQVLVQGSIDTAGAHSFTVLKLIATVASSISAIPGGIFAPSLAVGAGLGGDFAALFPSAPAQALVVLGMAAYFAGVVQAPITAFVIVTEMTNNHAMVVPLMLVSLIAFGASRLICVEGVYHALAHGFIGAGSKT